MLVRILCGLMLASIVGVASEKAAYAEISVAAKHLIVLKPGIYRKQGESEAHGVFGNYVFAVTNSTSEPLEEEVAVAMPQEVDDFQVEEGIEADEVRLGDDRGLLIKKAFPPGTHLISFRFFAGSDGNGVTLTMQPEYEIGELTVLVDKSHLRISGQGLQPSQVSMGEEYNSFQVESAIAAGSSYVLQVEGIPSDRSFLWLLGTAFVIALSGAAAVLAWRTRPRLQGSGDGVELILGEG